MGLLNKLQLKLQNLRSISLKYKENPSKEVYAQMIDTLKQLEKQESLDVSVPESITLKDINSIDIYKQNALAKLSQTTEMVEIKQQSFKRVVGLYDKQLKGPPALQGQKSQTQSKTEQPEQQQVPPPT